jgi:DNA-binding CsgD family transcriptional regulator
MIKLKIIEIASLLNISERKADQYKKSMMNKLNI